MKAFADRLFDIQKDRLSLKHKRNFLITALLLMILMIVMVVVGIAFLNLKSQGVTDVSIICLCITGASAIGVFVLLVLCAVNMLKEVKSISQRQSSIKEFAEAQAQQTIMELYALLNNDAYIQLKGFLLTEDDQNIDIDGCALSSQYQVTLVGLGENVDIASKTFSLVSQEETTQTLSITADTKGEYAVYTKTFCNQLCGIFYVATEEKRYCFYYTDDVDNTTALLNELVKRLQKQD